MRRVDGDHRGRGLGVEAHADHALVLERLRPLLRTARRSGLPPSGPARALSVATMPDPAAPGTTTRGCSPGSSMSSSDCWALRCSPPKTRIREPGSNSRDLRHRRGPFAGRLSRATAIPLSRRRPIRSLVDDLFLFRHGAPFRASEQQAYSRQVFLANSGNLEGKRLKRSRARVKDRLRLSALLPGRSRSLTGKGRPMTDEGHTARAPRAGAAQVAAARGRRRRCGCRGRVVRGDRRLRRLPRKAWTPSWMPTAASAPASCCCCG